MTIAVCLFCGEFKDGAFIKCVHCGKTPMTHTSMALCTEMSDQFYKPRDLFLFSASLKTKVMPELNQERINSIFDSYHTPQGEQMLRTMHGISNLSREFRTRMICERILEGDEDTRDGVTILINPSKMDVMASAFERMGIANETSQNRERYIRDALWNNEEALMRALPSSWLIHDAGDEAGKMVHCWTGSGRFVGTHAVSDIEDDFKRLGMDRVSLVFILSGFYPMLADALELPTTR